MRDLKFIFTGVCLVVCFTLAGCVHKKDFTKKVVNKFTEALEIGQNSHVGSLYLGGFSGLIYDDEAVHLDGKETFITITDRGPNSRSYDFNKDGVGDRGFLLPKFSPSIVWFTIDSKGVAKIQKVRSIHWGDNEKALGIPNQKWSTNKLSPWNQSGNKMGAFDESPFSIEGKSLSFNHRGMDPEGIVRDSRGNFWIVEEYGPSILKISAEGEVLKRFIPNYPGSVRYGAKVLPAILGERKLNRGFEGVTYYNGKIWAVLQSPLPYGKWSERKLGHIIEFDPVLEKTTGHYLFSFHARGEKVSALAQNKGNLYLLEQNGLPGANSFKKVFQLDFSNSTNLQKTKRSLHQWRQGDFLDKITTIDKSLFFSLDEMPEIRDHEKLEGMAFDRSGNMQIIVDNDFGVQGVLDTAGKVNKNFKLHAENYIFSIDVK